MGKEEPIKLFEQKQVHSVWDDDDEKWYFSIVDLITKLTGSIDPQSYWRKLKPRLEQDGHQTVIQRKT